MTLQRSALHQVAAAAGSDFQESYGWELPTVYSDAAAEYLAATSGAAVYDASYTGRLKATGEDGLDLLNRLSTNKVIDLQPGQGAPTILTTDRGRILDLIIVLNLGDHLLLLTSPGTQQQVIEWLDKYTIMEDLTVEDISESTAMLAVWGPGALGADVAQVGRIAIDHQHIMPAQHRLHSGAPLVFLGGGSCGRQRNAHIKGRAALTALGRHLGLFDNGRKAALMRAAAENGGTDNGGADNGGGVANSESGRADDARERLARRIAGLAARLGTRGPDRGAE